jgi:hypothetical protein
VGIAVVTIIGAATQEFANLGSAQSLVSGFHYGFIGAGILSLIAFVMALLIRRPKS